MRTLRNFGVKLKRIEIKGSKTPKPQNPKTPGGRYEFETGVHETFIFNVVSELW